MQLDYLSAGPLARRIARIRTTPKLASPPREPVKTPPVKTPELKGFTKLEAASRQINTAIWLWFKDADIVSIYTLTAAAFEILDGLFHHRKMGRPILFDDRYMPEGTSKRDIVSMLKEAETFSENTRKAPTKTLKLNPVWTELYLHSAINAYVKLTVGDPVSHPLMSLFVLRFAITRTQLFGVDAFPLRNKGLDVEKLKMLSKVEFFQELGGTFRTQPPPINSNLSHYP